MEVISKANESLLAILRKPKSVDGKYRKLHFCVEKPVEEGVLLYNVLTKELLLLTQEEYENYLELDYLREHYFVVPEGNDDQEMADLVRWVLSTRQQQGKEILGYTIFTTTDCNARCFYCFELGGSRIPMSHETALQVVQYIKNHCGGKAVKLTWFGGEPLYNLDAIDTICVGLQKEGIPYTSSMVTNAYLFDADVVQKALELWNLEWVQVAMDGTEEVYNRIKAYIYKEGNAYQRVMHNIGLLLDASVSVSVRMNMDLNNAQNLLELAQDLARHYGGREKLSVNVHYLFQGNEALADTYSREEWHLRNEAMCRIEDCLMQNGLAGSSGVPKKIRLCHCMADGGNAVTILPDGSIGLCEHHTESEFIGHINREGFDEEVVKSWKETVPAIAECATCFYYPDCIMLKKCSNVSRCFPEHRSRQFRKLLRRMENEFRKWQSN